MDPDECFRLMLEAARKLRALGPTADRLADRDWSASKHSAAVKMAAAVLELRKG